MTVHALRAPLILAVVLTTAAFVGCGDNDLETPTSPTAATPAPAAALEVHDDTLTVSGTTFYAFSVTEYGNVAITLESVTGPYVPATVMVGLGLGTPSGTDCVTTTTINTAAGVDPQLSGVYDPGVYCAKLWDIGNLYAPATFRLLIAHP